MSFLVHFGFELSSDETLVVIAAVALPGLSLENSDSNEHIINIKESIHFGLCQALYKKYRALWVLIES